MNKLQQLLSKPFPQEESLYDSLKIVAAISVFVVAFLYIFKPFGIHLKETDQFLLCLSFGLVTFTASMVYELVIVRVLKVKGGKANFTFAKWIFYMAGIMLFISLANFLFIRITLFDDIQWVLYPYMLRGTVAIGFFPIIFLGAFALLRQERKYQNVATQFNQKEPHSRSPKNDQDQSIFDLPSSRIRYIEAMQNYIKIGYVDADGQLQEQIERATLKSISKEALGNSILRCHRSFLVNREAIISASGNAQGLLLSLLDCKAQIPVSRSYVPAFKGH